MWIYNRLTNIIKTRKLFKNIINHKKINRILKLQQTMLELSEIIINENDINVLLNLVLEKVTAAIEKADIGAVLIVDKDKNVKIVASRGYADDEVNNFSIKLHQVFYIKQTDGIIGKPIIINDIQNFEQTHSERALHTQNNDKLNSSLSTPILLNGKLYGFINIESTFNNAFDDNDIEVLDYLKRQIEIGISKNLLYEETIYLSRYDKMTNLYNRGYFEELFNNTILDAEKNGKDFLFVVIDLNYLKPINDNHGHLAGDELIRAFAKTLKDQVSNDTILARLGGDEFAAIFFNITPDKLIEVMENLNKKLKETPICFETACLNCSFSYGIAHYPQSGNDYNSLFKTADMNMYEYKKKFKVNINE